eukprot:763425-Hanusia_phi.AAC.1
MLSPVSLTPPSSRLSIYLPCCMPSLLRPPIPPSPPLLAPSSCTSLLLLTCDIPPVTMNVPEDDMASASASPSSAMLWICKKVQHKEVQVAMIRQKQASQTQAWRPQGSVSTESGQGTELAHPSGRWDVGSWSVRVRSASDSAKRYDCLSTPAARCWHDFQQNSGGGCVDPVLDERSSERRGATLQGSPDDTRRVSLIGDEMEKKTAEQAPSSYHEARLAYRDVEET